MSLRRRLAVTVAAAVALALAVAAVVAYAVTRSELRGQVDDRLREQAAMIPPPPGVAEAPGPGGAPFELPATEDPDVGPPAAVRVEGPEGDVLIERGDVPNFEVEPDEEAALEDATSDGEHVRVVRAPLPGGGSVVLARSLEGVDDALGTLRTVLFFVVVGGAALAALGARLIAARLLVPVGRLTEAAEHVSQTEDLSRRIDIDGEDEVAELGARFNSMLARLEVSRNELDSAHDQQRQLIADASHELRTPVTALRTNIEVIAGGGLDAADEQLALEAASAQAEELGVLIGDLMDLARGEPAEMELQEVRLDDITREAVERARRNSPAVTYELSTEVSVVHGSPERIARAVNNLLDNAAQHGGGGRVEVSVADGIVAVRDHGPGVSANEAERIFDRFYRGPEARRRPGSGLGLAIVRQVAEAHGGSVAVRSPEGGGATFELRLS